VAGKHGDYCGRQRVAEAGFLWAAQVAEGSGKMRLDLSEFQPKSMLHVPETKVSRSKYRLLIFTPTFRFARNPSMALHRRKRWNFWQHRKAFARDGPQKYQDHGELDRGSGKGLEEAVQRFQLPHPDRFLTFTEPSWDHSKSAGLRQISS